MCKVSVVIPVYNVERYLDTCLASVVNQTLKDIQIILVNDGSTDNCGEICSMWAEKDNRIVVIQKENGGIASARLTGAEKAVGEYVWNVDGDDYMMPEMAETLYTAAKENDCDVAVCGFARVNDLGVYENYRTKLSGVYHNIEGERALFLNDAFIWPTVWNRLFRRDKYIKNLCYCDVRLCTSEDFAISVPNLLSANKVIYIDRSLYFYRTRDGQITEGYKKTTYESEMLAERKILQAANDMNIDILDAVKRKCVFYSFHQILNILKNVDDKKERNAEITKWCDNDFYKDVNKSKWRLKEKIIFHLIKGKHILIIRLLQKIYRW